MSCEFCGRHLDWCECEICECCSLSLEECDCIMLYDPDDIGFADPGGDSALRAASDDNPRNLPCPTCGTENVLTPADVARGYQCNTCARELEQGF